MSKNCGKISYMPKYSILMAIILAFSCPALAADDVVRLNARGEFLDGKGKVIALQNKGDARNSAERKFYSYLNDKGIPNGYSDFFIVNDIWDGFKKINLNNNTKSPEENKEPQKINIQPQNSMVTNYTPANTKVILQKNPDVPIYDSLDSRGAYE